MLLVYNSQPSRKNVDLVITTDTSVSHISGTMDINCCILLTSGRDWRWGNNISNWYPNIKQFIQDEPLSWIPVVDKLKEYLITNYC